MEKVTIIGGGSWGTALGCLLIENKKDVLIYDTNKLTVEEINTIHTNASKLKGIELPISLKATNDLSVAVGFSDVLILAVPTEYVRNALKNINTFLTSAKIFCNVSKGLELVTHKRVSEIANDELDSKYLKGFVTLSGPSHAEEVVLKKITSVVAASLEIENARYIQQIFSNHYFRVYTSQDIIGVELSGSLKNIFAIASGITDGLGFGINTKAALITRGLVEMKRIAVGLGASEQTLNGLCGVGDLIVTCTSDLSRNYSAGVLIGKGADIDKALDKIHMVVEGVKTCKSAYNLSKDLGLETPIIHSIYQILFNKSNPTKELNQLMSRKLIEE